jgi:peptidoglycan hydrolase-like protein with peptidoglycan-binding domain
MQVGARGPCVEELQRTLRKVGLNVVQDGVFGQQTKGAVVAFQAQEGLPKVSYVGPQTRAALGRQFLRACPQLPGLSAAQRWGLQ